MSYCVSEALVKLCQVRANRPITGAPPGLAKDEGTYSVWRRSKSTQPVSEARSRVKIRLQQRRQAGKVTTEFEMLYIYAFNCGVFEPNSDFFSPETDFGPVFGIIVHCWIDCSHLLSVCLERAKTPIEYIGLHEIQYHHM